MCLVCVCFLKKKADSIWPLLFPYVPLKLLFPKFNRNWGTNTNGNIFLYFSFLISINIDDNWRLGFSFHRISSIPVSNPPYPNNNQGFRCRRSQGKKVPLHHRKSMGLLQIQVWNALWPWFLMGFCNKIVVFLLYTFNWKILSIYIYKGFCEIPRWFKPLHGEKPPTPSGGTLVKRSNFGVVGCENREEESDNWWFSCKTWRWQTTL